MNQQHPAGWYSQPDGSQRFWDGQQWTNHVAPGQAQAAGLTAPQPTGPTEPQGTAPRPWFKKKRIVIP
ncbi:DUF2510 domain-containing protein [Tessaracoccus sp. HDW20]|uniref:DUF2510 domain-containing protein n=1 Tax=Tessaracoccus coleopterorum TaxID=2714950 RepID=UPI0018D2FDE5|nr:DUF2510 domain-containing protein [Tessaracoccus coleopterorum]NHB85128.1 DUF2510 domain-containing protein [Tessaracoccus coleopterorum]